MMYHQVYYHKTVLAASAMLQTIFRRARDLAQLSKLDCITSDLAKVLDPQSLEEEALQAFVQLNDAHIWVHLQYWIQSKDQVLSDLSAALLHRNLWTTEFSTRKFSDKFTHTLEEKIQKKLNLQQKEATYYIASGDLKEKDIDANAKTSALQYLVTTMPYERYYVCYPKLLNLR